MSQLNPTNNYAPRSSLNDYRSGFVAVIGKPNVGKSTLINTILGTKIAAVSPWPQTTRKRQLGIYSSQDAQIVFIDTPGVHQPLHKLGEYMNKEAAAVLEECDLILFMVDLSQPAGIEDEMIADLIKSLKQDTPALLILNKVDLVEPHTAKTLQGSYQDIIPQAKAIQISAITGINVHQLIEEIISLLPVSPPFYPEDQLTDIYERDIAADLIRESALNHLFDEVPHSISIRIDEFTERNEHGAFIAATLFVERESQKPIVIGQGGEKLKQIGTDARLEIERMSGRKIFLQLRVKVRKNWRNDESALRLFGFSNK
ncbi:MAG: GTPase Era [Anaerolineales bacterium]|nr:GTPase Era [Anaerolineales bacterium]